VLHAKLERRAEDEARTHSQSDFGGNANSEQQHLLKQWVETAVTDQTEKLLLKLTYEFDMKPREIIKAYPTHFSTIADVYRIKERILKRARYALKRI